MNFLNRFLDKNSDKKENAEVKDKKKDEMENASKADKKTEEKSLIEAPQPKFKPIVKKSMVAILLEDSKETAKYKNIIEKIIRNIILKDDNNMPKDIIYILKYNNNVVEFVYKNIKEINFNHLFSKNYENDKCCLDDAIVKLSEIINKEYCKKKETEKEIIYYESAEIIGIGRCIDTNENTLETISILLFSKIANRENINTKYYSISNECMVNAAKYGFRSIGSMNHSFI